jgi:Protein of unknown function (DUF2608)
LYKKVVERSTTFFIFRKAGHIMNKLALIGLDRVIADGTLRFTRADQTASARYDEQTQNREWNDLYWATAFTPELVQLDTLIDGVLPSLNLLTMQGYTIVILTSRPENMRLATLEWLNQHGVPFAYLAMKPPVHKYTKSRVWLAGKVCELSCMLGADEVMYVESDEGARAEVLRYSYPFALTVYPDLAMQSDDDDNPF